MKAVCEDCAMRVLAADRSDAAAIAQVQVDTWRTTYTGLMPDAVLARLSYERSAQNWRSTLESPNTRTRLFVVTDEGDGVFGFAATGPERTGSLGFSGEIYALYVLPAHQGQGAGRALVRASAEYLVSQDTQDMLIWVLRDNASGRGFYQAIGGQAVAERDVDIGGASLAEVGYGWRDLSAWLANQP
jgi:ribosomal protein S18 acetylase RimI-like enzyme